MSDDAKVEKLGGPQEAMESLPSAQYGGQFESAQRSSEAIHNLDGSRIPISIAIDPVALITTECITVTSAMRKHARWAHSSVSSILGGSTNSSSSPLQGSRPSTPGDDFSAKKGAKAKVSLMATTEDGGLANRWGLRGKKGKSMQDNPLMAGFSRLRRELVGCKGMEQIVLLGSFG
jgi:brefeldin A-resistance guanine nucleotide exchange factor 1